MRIHITDPGYPSRLSSMVNPPLVLTTSGPIEARRAVMIAGSRSACEESLDYAFALAYHLARAGVVVISGGALGVDYEAHRGAIAAEGTTWVVSPSGRNVVQPPSHRAFFEQIAASETSRMIWPFHDDARDEFLYRNSVAVALADAVVIIEARLKSGSRNAAKWARSMPRPLFIVPGFPWSYGFQGSLAELELGGRVLTSVPALFTTLELAPPELDDPRSARRAQPTHQRTHKAQPFRKKDAALPRPIAPFRAPDQGAWSEAEKRVYSVLSVGPIHRERIVQNAGLEVSSTVTALLTLSLKDVVVEGPDGFFRRRNAT